MRRMGTVGNFVVPKWCNHIKWQWCQNQPKEDGWWEVNGWFDLENAKTGSRADWKYCPECGAKRPIEDLR